MRGLGRATGSLNIEVSAGGLHSSSSPSFSLNSVNSSSSFLRA